ERCLANPGVTLEQQCLPAVGHSTQEAIERQQLFTPAYEVDWHRTLFRRAIAPRLRFAYTRSLPRRTDNRRSHSGPGASGAQERPIRCPRRLRSTSPTEITPTSSASRSRGAAEPRPAALLCSRVPSSCGDGT